MKFFPLSCIALLMISHLAISAEDDPFAELDQEISQLKNAGSASELQEFQRWKSSYLAEYQAFRKEHFNRVDDIRDNLISLWGESDNTSPAQLVKYSPDQHSKAVIDFEKNEVRISILHDRNKDVSGKDVAKTLALISKSEGTSSPLAQLVGKKVSPDISQKLIANARVTEHVPEVVADNVGLINKEINIIEKQAQVQQVQVEKIFDLDDSSLMSEEKIQDSSAIEEQINQEKRVIEQEKLARIKKLKAQTLKLNKSEKRSALERVKITTYTMPLGNKKQILQAQPFVHDVQEQSKRWDLTPSLLLAIIHTESHFNPIAESKVPAFGLMQIVPRTAGVDVNRFLFKKDAALSQSYLLQSQNNIEAGVAYMHILDKRYLKKITDPLSRMYCMIAAYNTGTGNVAKAFNSDKSRNIVKAAKVINALTPQQVYLHLLASLPYKETKNYVERVVRRKKIYLSFDTI